MFQEDNVKKNLNKFLSALEETQNISFAYVSNMRQFAAGATWLTNPHQEPKAKRSLQVKNEGGKSKATGM